MPRRDEPLFTHDCDSCQFLGTHKGLHDLYYCPGEPTVVARYGNDGPDYKSGLAFAFPGGTECLYEARIRAVQRGFDIE